MLARRQTGGPSAPRVLIVTNVPTPYRVPLFAELARQLAELGVDLTVVFAARGYARREWEIDWKSMGFNYEVLGEKPIRLGFHERYLFTYAGLRRLIRTVKPIIVITPGFSLATMLLRLLRMRGGVSYLIWSGEIRRQSALREIYRKWLARGAWGFIAYGSRATRYLQSLGAGEARIWTAINTVETGFFGAQFKRRMARDQARSSHVLLCISALVPRKQVESVLRVGAVLAFRRSDFGLAIVGGGPEREKLENRARDLGIASRVTFTGHLQRPEVAETLSRASCFLFPTQFDIWGLVLVEAMAAGLPCISSVHAGATYDLIEDGVTGYAVDFADAEAVADRVEKVLDDEDHARAMGAAAHEAIERRGSLAVSAQGFVAAIQSCIAAMKCVPSTGRAA